MQETRQLILEILHTRGSATVDDIVAELEKRRGNITSVTVRHHLLRLQKDGFITTPELRRRSSPGRPQYLYSLTPKAENQFPTNYPLVLESLLEELQKQIPAPGVNVIIEGMATNIAQRAGITDVDPEVRMDLVVDFLTQHGYDAHWEAVDEGFYLHTVNCPYQRVAEHSTLMCELDLRLIEALMGAVPRRVEWRAEGSEICSYLIPVRQTQLSTAE